MSADRARAGRFVRRNGAYLLEAMETPDCVGEATPDALYDVAGSERVARQVTVEMARALGWHGSPRWYPEAIGGGVELEMSWSGWAEVEAS